MHEITLVNNIVSILEKEAASADVGEIKTVFLEIGALRYVIPEIMTSCFACAPRSDKLKKTRIDIKIVPVRGKCSDCGEAGELAAHDFRCGACRGGNVSIVSGNEFMIKGIEY